MKSLFVSLLQTHNIIYDKTQVFSSQLRFYLLKIKTSYLYRAFVWVLVPSLIYLSLCLTPLWVSSYAQAYSSNDDISHSYAVVSWENVGSVKQEWQKQEPQRKPLWVLGRVLLVYIIRWIQQIIRNQIELNKM